MTGRYAFDKGQAAVSSSLLVYHSGSTEVDNLETYKKFFSDTTKSTTLKSDSCPAMRHLANCYIRRCLMQGLGTSHTVSVPLKHDPTQLEIVLVQQPADYNKYTAAQIYERARSRDPHFYPATYGDGGTNLVAPEISTPAPETLAPVIETGYASSGSGSLGSGFGSGSGSFGSGSAYVATTSGPVYE